MKPNHKSEKMMEKLKSETMKNDQGKKRKYYQSVYPILDDLYEHGKSYVDPNPPLFSVVDDNYGYAKDAPMTPERYKYETTEAYYRTRQYKKELNMLCNETESNMANRNHDAFLSTTEFRQFVLLRFLRNKTLDHLHSLNADYPYTDQDLHLERFNDVIMQYLKGMIFTCQKVHEPVHTYRFEMDLNTQKVIKIHEIGDEVEKRAEMTSISRLDIVNTLIEINLFDWHNRYETKQMNHRIADGGAGEWHLKLLFTKRKANGFDVYGSDTLPWNFMRLTRILQAD
ncbi:MAG: hypothetical protein ACI32F_05780 [Allobaculum sp.]